MKKIIYIVIIVLVIGIGLFFFLNNKNAQKENVAGQPNVTQTAVDDKTMVDCGKGEDPNCFINRMNQCLPVTVTMIGTDNKTNIQLTVYGVENEKCHFERKVSNNSALDLKCLFPKGTMNMDTIGQTFGQDKGLKQVVDDACKAIGW